jgi:hypothetical protein
MRSCKYLSTLHKSCEKNIARLRKAAGAAAQLQEKDADLSITYITLELLNTWSNFTRAYYLSCFLLPKTIKGEKITTILVASDSNDAVSIAMRKLKPNSRPTPNGIWKRRDEPTWHEQRNFLILSEHIGVSNLEDVRSALSNGFTVFNDLVVFRNFFAHRNQSTEKSVKPVSKNYGILVKKRPSQLLLTNPINRTQPLLLD